MIAFVIGGKMKHFRLGADSLRDENTVSSVVPPMACRIIRKVQSKDSGQVILTIEKTFCSNKFDFRMKRLNFVCCLNLMSDFHHVVARVSKNAEILANRLGCA